MSFNLADLRKQRGNDFSAITSALKKTSYEDDDSDFFKLEKDKAGNGSAVIRFLPKHPDDALPWVVLYTHGFQGPTGRWYIENSLSTLGQEDPVSQFNRELWSTGLERDKEQARKQKRKTSYIANILVVSYPSNPALEGKVMRFKFGKKIFEKIQAKTAPKFQDEIKANPFDPFEGCDLKLRMCQVEGYPNYDNSIFADPAPMAKTDTAMQAILDQITPLAELIAPSKFKTYDELKKKFDTVMNSKPASTHSAEDVADMMSAPQKPVGRVVEQAKPQVSKPAVVATDDDDIESYFKSIAND